MIARRLQQLRLARNLSLEALAAKMGGIVTKQAISKYEHGLANPSPVVLAKLAEALGVRASYFLEESGVRVEFIAYRSAAGLRARESKQLESRIRHELESRVAVLDLLGKSDGSRVPVRAYAVHTLQDAEVAAEKLRAQWRLGLEPIANVTETLENNLTCVFDIETGANFDGISAKVYDAGNHLKTVALVTRNKVDGVRQRLNLAHELGHVVMKVDEGMDEEAAAFRFGAAFLAPAAGIIEEVGEKREVIQLEELLHLKRRFGLSVQSLLHRLLELGVIRESHYSEWRALLNKMGWKMHEPEDWPFEKSEWMSRQVLRLVAEGVVGVDQAESLLGRKLNLRRPESLVERREFLKLPIEKRRKIMAQQALVLAQQYAGTTEEKGSVGGGDLIEY